MVTRIQVDGPGGPIDGYVSASPSRTSTSATARRPLLAIIARTFSRVPAGTAARSFASQVGGSATAHSNSKALS
jgi:hypothetical protein